MNLVEKARLFATKEHSGQKRKYGDRPYIYHPTEVVAYLQSKGYDDTNLLSAGFLHDTVEDCPGVTYNTLEKEFGPAVAELVREVSHPTSMRKSRSERWLDYLEHYESASTDGKILKLVDRICNLREYFQFWSEVPAKARKFLDKVYLEESADLAISLMNIDKSLDQDLRYVIDQLDELLVASQQEK